MPLTLLLTNFLLVFLLLILIRKMVDGMESKLKFWVGSTLACSELEVKNGKNLWKWCWLEIKLDRLFLDQPFQRKICNPASHYMSNINKRNTRTKVWNMFKVNNKDTKTTPAFLLCFRFYFYSVSIVNFEHVIAGWEEAFQSKKKVQTK